jgi:translation initiation factor IF-3
MAHPDLGKALLDQLADQLRPHGIVEQPPRMEGRTMIMFMAPLKAKSSVADREREREKEGSRAREQVSDQAAKDENPQRGQEAVQDHRDRQGDAHQRDEESQPAQEGAAREATV